MAAGTSLLEIEGGSQVAAALTNGPTAVFPTLGPLMPVAFFGSFVPGTGVEGAYTLDDTSFSLFGQFDYELTDRLTISGGVAYLDDSKTATGNSNLTDALSNFANAVFLAKSKPAGSTKAQVPTAVR